MRQLGTDLGAFTVTDGLNQQITQRPPLELDLAEHIEDLAAERLARLLQFLQQGVVDVALTRLLGHEIPEVAHFRLADTVDAAESLLNAVGIPRQIVVHHQVGALKVDALAGGIGSHQHLYLGIVFEGFLRLRSLFAAHAAVNDDHGLLASKQGCNYGASR